MKKPLVAIVGRPNVGKSTFFNKICGKRISIVEDTPGVTRDRIYADAEWCGHNFTLVDTGGLDFKSDDIFIHNIINQAQIAMDLADVIVFMVDGRDGLTPSDHDVANHLRKSKKPCILVVNKLDRFEIENSFEFYELGMGEPFPISCEQSKGLGEVLDAIVGNFNEKFSEEQNKAAIKIAVVGRPNAGKSSITNRIVGEDRVIVSAIAGTTRDAIDTPFKYMGKDYILIDTAGMRRNKAVDNGSVESYSIIRAMEAIKRADVVLVVFDASEEITEQDIRIAGFVHEEGKPSVIIMNKWDKIEEDDKSVVKYTNSLKEKLSYMSYFKPLFLSALTGKRIGLIMPTVCEVLENASRRITTGVLNDILQASILANDTPAHKGRKLKISYATQVSVAPPTFVFFCNEAALMHFSYLRYLENRIRSAVNFEGTPLKLIAKGREEKE
ncbi:MAG: ribosome biogenesis GTPase Der [Clostridia bacterium]